MAAKQKAFVFKSHRYKGYRTTVYDGATPIPVVFSNGLFITYDGKLAKLIYEQKVGKDLNVQMDEETKKMFDPPKPRPKKETEVVPDKKKKKGE